MKTKDYTDPRAFLRDAYGRGARRPRRPAAERRPDIPRAPRAESTGLSGLVKRGWSVTFDGARYRLERGEMDTGWGEEKAVCDEAKRMERET